MNDYEDVTFEFENRQYVKPEASLNERNQFIDTLKDVQAKNTAEINRNTYNLGSPVSSNVGGLGGAEGLWKAQYQTPQTDAQVANLKSVAQQEALNTALTNLQNIYQNRYKQAQRAAYRRASKRNRGGGGGTTTPTTTSDTPEGKTIFEDTNEVAVTLEALPDEQRAAYQKEFQNMRDQGFSDEQIMEYLANSLFKTGGN